jgi:hypothetical protein
VARAYGLADDTPSLAIDGHRLDFDGDWRFDGKPLNVPLAAPSRLLHGPGDLYYGIGPTGVALIAADGTLIEALDAAHLKAKQLSQAGGDHTILCLGDGKLQCTRDGAIWEAAPPTLPPLEPIATLETRPGIERLLLDLHAGRILGAGRKTVATLLALVLLILPLSGLHLARLSRHLHKTRDAGRTVD